MPIDHFTREQFEVALPLTKAGNRAWVPGDYNFYLPGCQFSVESSFVDKGEFIYSLPVYGPTKDHLYIAIRSSVKSDGLSANTGEDSIRLWLMRADCFGGGPVAGKLTKHITRVKGWDKRMTTQLRTLYKIGLSLKPCPTCGDLMHAFTAGKGKNATAKPENVGRLFQRCVRNPHSFEWIDFKEEKKCTKVT